MPYSFPFPQEVPLQVKQKVMNHVFPKKTSLVKRSLLIKVSSIAVFGILLFVFGTYIRTSLISSFPQSETIPSHQNIASIQISSNDLSLIENNIAETEKVLIELESLI